MKIRTEFLFEDQDEFIAFFQTWFEKQPEIVEEQAEPETLTEPISENKKTTGIILICQNPDCGKEFTKKESGFSITFIFRISF